MFVSLVRMKTDLTKTPAVAVFGGSRFISARQLMPSLGYSDRGAFFAAVRAAGVPFIVFNKRKILFDESAVAAWLAARRVGGQSS